MNATLFLNPRYARTAPDPRPIPWGSGLDVRALAAYIRAWIVQNRAKPEADHGHC